MEIISSKQEEEFKATTIVVNILKLHTNSKVWIQEFLWIFEVLITSVLDIIYSFVFDYIISMPVPFKRHLLVKIRCINAVLSALKVEQNPKHLLKVLPRLPHIQHGDGNHAMVYSASQLMNGLLFEKKPISERRPPLKFAN